MRDASYACQQRRDAKNTFHPPYLYSMLFYSSTDRQTECGKPSRTAVFKHENACILPSTTVPACPQADWGMLRGDVSADNAVPPTALLTCSTESWKHLQEPAVLKATGLVLLSRALQNTKCVGMLGTGRK